MIEPYLNALCAALNVDPLRRDEIRLEVHTHLRQRADALVRDGMDPETAERRAMEEFGEPHIVALQMDRHRGVFPLPRLERGWTRHIQRVGVFFYATGFIGLILILTDLCRSLISAAPQNGFWFLQHQPYLKWDLLPIPLGFCLLHLALGLALMHLQRWARLAAMFLGLLYLLAFLGMPALARHELPGSSSLEIAVRGLMAILGFYTLWAFCHPHHHYVKWAKDG